MKIRYFSPLAFAVGCLLVAAAAFAQATTGTLSGTVTSGGEPVRGVTVTVTLPTGESRAVETDSRGHYTFTGLPPGNYSVSFELEGLQTETRDVEIRTAETADLDADLQATPGFAAEVTVTGSLIPRPTIEAASPVATLEVEELQAQGSTRLEDFLTNLPQVFTGQNSTISNGATGTATVDLRNIGVSRTLVLIDGRRMPPGDVFVISPDLNFIPAALVKRVDVLTGGASTVYGADAVAGVVNFILDTDFEGVRAGLSGGVYHHNNRSDIAREINALRGFPIVTGDTWDGGQFEAFTAFGGKFGEKGHGSLFVDYRKTEEMLKSARDYTNCSVTGLQVAGPRCAGSSTIPSGRFLLPSGVSYTLDQSGPGNTFRPYSGSTDPFNFAPFNFMQRPDERWSAGGFLNYEWSQHAEGYASLMLMDDTSDAQIAPSGTFFVPDRINCDNPMLSADQVQKLCTAQGFGPNDMASVFIGKRNVEGGPRADLLDHQSYRLLAGLRGDITSAWSYDVFGLRGQTRYVEQYINDMHSERIQDALIVDGDPNDPSTWHCRSGNAGCVPYNLFRVGGVTQEALDYVQIPLLSNGDVLNEMVSATVSGDLKQWGLAFPTAAEGISLALGVSYSNFGLDYVPDENYRRGLATGQGGAVPPVSGSYNVNELYTELLLPIVQGVPGFRNLSLELGYRTSDYSNTGRYPTYKAMLQYAPTQSFKFRGGYNRATRSPNINELFEPQSIGLGGSEDICAGPNPTATREQCARTGVTAAQYGHILDNPAAQYNTLEGGNPNLTPEIGDTVTAGLVITPTGLPGLSLAIDYYDIKLEDTIGTLGANQIVSACAETGDPQLCSLIHRDRLGTLWLTPDAHTITTNINVGELRAEGVDVNLNLVQPVGGSSLSLNLIGTYLLTSFTDFRLYSYDCVGYYGDDCGDPSPDWQHYSRIGWQFGNAGVSLGWRYLGLVTVDAANTAVALADPESIPAYRAVGSYRLDAKHYFDVAANYNFSEATRFTVGVNNIDDKEPPLGAGIDDFDFGPGYFGTYDPYGRYVHASLVFNFK